jgi:hypothetical protein
MPLLSFPAVLPVLHGAPAIHRPRAARSDRLTVVRMSTDCAVGRGLDGDMEPVHVRNWVANSFHERDGSLWARVCLSSPALQHRFLAPAELERLLREDLDPDDPVGIAFRRYFSRTPLAPRDAVTGRQVAFEAKRAQGEDLPARGPGHVVEDGRDRCAHELRDFLANDLLVTERAVYLRTAPVIRGTRECDGGRIRFVVEPRRSFEPQLRDEAPIPYEGRIRYPAANDPHDREVAECVRDLERTGWTSRHGDADLRVMANTLPAWIVGSVTAYNRDGEPRGVEPHLLAGLRADAFLGMTGSIQARDVQPTLARIAQALRPHTAWLLKHERFGPAKGMGGYAHALIDHIEDSVLPRADRVPDCDADALSTLAFRP